jgi:hypothetical protein
MRYIDVREQATTFLQQEWCAVGQTTRCQISHCWECLQGADRDIWNSSLWESSRSSRRLDFHHFVDQNQRGNGRPDVPTSSQTVSKMGRYPAGTGVRPAISSQTLGALRSQVSADTSGIAPNQRRISCLQSRRPPESLTERRGKISGRLARGF